MSHEGIRFVDKEHAARESEENRPLARIAVTPEKVRVLLSEGKGLEIDWQDGHRSAWTFAWLRDACPAPPATRSAPSKAASPASPSPSLPTLYRCSPRRLGLPAPTPSAATPPVQLAGRPYCRHLFLGISPPRLPMPRMHLRRPGNIRRAELDLKVEASGPEQASAGPQHHSFCVPVEGPLLNRLL